MLALEPAAGGPRMADCVMVCTQDQHHRAPAVAFARRRCALRQSCTRSAYMLSVHILAVHVRERAYAPLACVRAHTCSPCNMPVTQCICVYTDTHTHVCVRACVGACGSWGRGGRRRADHILLEKPMADNEADCAAIGEVRMQHRAVGLSCF